MVSLLKEYYCTNVIPDFIKNEYYKNVMEVPKIIKVVLNMGVGLCIKDKKILLRAIEILTIIAAQKAVPTKAKKSNASFKIREGWEIGCKVTLRKGKMYNFLDRLLTIALPRVRDFRGLSTKSFDGYGNYSLGVKEHIIFPEIDKCKVDHIFGFDVTIVTSAKNDKDCYQLLSFLHFPFTVE